MFGNIETGGPGLPVDVETFWSMAVFFLEPGITIANIYIYICTLWLFNIAMENGPFIDDFPIKTSIYFGDFPWLC